MWHRPPLYNRCDILCFQTIGWHIKSVTAYPMWVNTYHNGYLPDVRSGWHTTSPLGTSVVTRCEMSISTDVKCHFCSSVCTRIILSDTMCLCKKGWPNGWPKGQVDLPQESWPRAWHWTIWTHWKEVCVKCH